MSTEVLSVAVPAVCALSLGVGVVAARAALAAAGRLSGWALQTVLGLGLLAGGATMTYATVGHPDRDKYDSETSYAGRLERWTRYHPNPPTWTAPLWVIMTLGGAAVLGQGLEKPPKS